MTLTTTLLPPHSISPAISEAVIDGRDVSSFPLPDELTIAEAAKILDRREGLIHALIEDGEIASRIINGERFVIRDSFLNYKQDRERKSAWLAEMVQWDQEMGLYDD